MRRFHAGQQPHQSITDRSILPGPIGSGTSYPLFNPTPSEQDLLDDFYQRRVDRLTQSNWSDPRSQSHMDGLLESQGRLEQLLLQGDLIADNIDFGSSSDLGTQGELLAYLMSEGLAHGGSLNADGGWDTHDNLGEQHGLHNDLFIGLKRLPMHLTPMVFSTTPWLWWCLKCLEPQ